MRIENTHVYSFSYLDCKMNRSTLEHELRKCIEEIRDIQTSSSSRSHAGPSLTLHALKNRYKRLSEQLEKLNTSFHK